LRNFDFFQFFGKIPNCQSLDKFFWSVSKNTKYFISSFKWTISTKIKK
jgi:hypothetical protein